MLSCRTSTRSRCRTDRFELGERRCSWKDLDAIELLVEDDLAKERIEWSGFDPHNRGGEVARPGAQTEVLRRRAER